MENQARFSVLVLNDDVVSTYLTTHLLRESNLFHTPLVFDEVDKALRYIQQNCLDCLPVLPIPQIMLIDINLFFKDGFDFVGALQQLCLDWKESTTLCFLTFS